MSVESSKAEAPVEATLKRHAGDSYVFAVGMRDGAAMASFRVTGLSGAGQAEVLREGRTLEVRDGLFADAFQPWDVHLYRIRAD